MTQGPRPEPGWIEEAVEPAPQPAPFPPVDAGQVPASIPIAAALRPSPRRRFGRWFAAALGALIGGLVLHDAATFLIDAFQRSLELGLAFATLFAAVVVTGVLWARSEVAGLRQLADAEALRAEVLELLAAPGYGRALPFLDRVYRTQRIHEDPALAFRIFRAQVLDTHDDRQVLSLFAARELGPLDEAARRVVARAAIDAAVGVSVSPIAAIDALIAVLRSLRMVRDVARIYGLRPGRLAMTTLIRRIFLSGALSAGADAAGDATAGFLAEAIGSRVTSVLSARLAEGTFAAVRIARLGLQTIAVCRPVPFEPGQEPRLTELLRGVRAALRGEGAAR